MKIVLRWLVVGCLLLLAACAMASRCSEQPPKVKPQTQAFSAYRIGVDDVVKVSAWQNPDLDVTIPVRPDGMISLPLVGE